MSFLSGTTLGKRDQVAASVQPTYRHLLSPQAMTVFNPLRTIAHCDIDAAYAQFEQVRLGLPDDVPLICAQWQSIIAVNYPARKYGIKRFTTIDDAKKMCPHLYVQHVATYREGEAEAGYWDHVDPKTHKVSLDPYRRESLKILAIFKEMAPKGEIEKASIDEAFLDLTPMVIDRLLIRHPYLSSVPSDAPDGLDSLLPHPPPIDWSRAGNIFPADGEEGPTSGTSEYHVGDEDEEGVLRSDGPSSQVGSDGEMEGLGYWRRERRGRLGEQTWEDWALCLGAEIMADLRNEVWKKLHYTCSAGIAHNKPLAKLCSSWKKPNSQTVLRKSATPAFLRDREFQEIRFLGGKLGAAIAEEYNAKTVGDMLNVPLEEMQSRFGEESIWIYNILRGIDHTEVKEKIATKSMLASKNVRPSVTTPEQGHHWLSVLAGELNVRLRESRQVAPGLWPKTLVLSTRTIAEASRSRQTPFPFTKNLNTDYIVKFARKLWDEATQPLAKGTMKLNNIALAFTGLERLEGGQKGIEGFFSTVPIRSTSTDLKSAESESLKRLRSISPSRLITPPIVSEPLPSSSKRPRLPTLHAGKTRPKTALESFLRKGSSKADQDSFSAVVASNSAAVEAEEKSNEEHESGNISCEMEEICLGTHWVCPKCKAIFTEDEIVKAEDIGGDEESGRWKSLETKKQEHEDFHFAMELDGAGGSSSGGGIGSQKVSTSKVERGGFKKGPKVKKKPEGIKAFFAPKKT